METEVGRRSHHDIVREFQLSLELNPDIIEHEPAYEFRKVKCIPCRRTCQLNGDYNLANFFIHCDSSSHLKKLMDEGLVWKDADSVPRKRNRLNRDRSTRRRPLHKSPLLRSTVQIVDTYNQTRRILEHIRKHMPNPEESAESTAERQNTAPQNQQLQSAEGWQTLIAVTNSKLKAYMQNFPFKLQLEDESGHKGTWAYTCQSCKPNPCRFCIRVLNVETSAGLIWRRFEYCGAHHVAMADTLLESMLNYTRQFHSAHQIEARIPVVQ